MSAITQRASTSRAFGLVAAAAFATGLLAMPASASDTSITNELVPVDADVADLGRRVFSFKGPGPTIDFDEDTGTRPNGYAPVDGLGNAHFSDSNGGVVDIFNYGAQSFGNALAVFNDFDDSHVIMNFDTTVRHISMAFGNDDPGFSNPGDQAVLRGFDGPNGTGTQVAVASVPMNRNDVMDQTIEITSTTCIKSATFKYAVNPAQGLIEVIDNVHFELCAAAPGGDCDLTPIENKLDDETRFTDDDELAVIEGKIDALQLAIDALNAKLCDIVRLLHTPQGRRTAECDGTEYDWNGDATTPD
jgi:hypothetical protein